MTTMIVLAWVGFLALLVKLKVLKSWATWMKLSPIAVWLLAQIFLLIPMGFDASSGPAVVLWDSANVHGGFCLLYGIRIPISEHRRIPSTTWGQDS
jgi:hypothetical protein